MNLAELLEAAKDLPALLDGMPPAELTKLSQAVMSATSSRRFIPNPGPQTQALRSEAEIIMYGGAAGAGKTYLACGLAEEHQHTIVFRRDGGQLDGLIRDSKEMYRGLTNYVGGHEMLHTWPDGRTLKFAGMLLPDSWSKHAGRERDCIIFDEGGEFLEQQVASIMAWNRGPAGQRCRMLFPTNPPRSSDGAWVRKWFAPWIDPAFEDPAESGEIRWACFVANGEGGVDQHWTGPGTHAIEGVSYTARSLTFIRASLKDNPYRDTPEYRARLESLPEPLRSQVLFGDFTAGTEDVEWQAVPSSWVQQAQARWHPQPPLGVPMCAIGIDAALGGKDRAAIARRYDGWYARMINVDGKDIKSGQQLGGHAMSVRTGNARLITDVGGGWGADCHAHLARNQLPCDSYMGVRPSMARTRDEQFPYFNIRSQAVWQFREALDPFQPGGSRIFLPPSARLMADLTAPRYDTKSGKLRIESKEDVCKRLKRSTDEGDAVIMAWHVGDKIATSYDQWQANSSRPRVVSGRSLSARIRR